MALTVYGIPSCGTVKKARAWLDAHGLAHTFVDLRQTPPPREQVARWVAALGSGPLRNTSGAAFRALPADKADWSDDRWTEAFAADPMLIRRPVIEKDGTVVSSGFRGTDEELLARMS